MSVSEELIIYLKVLWRYKWTILACAILSMIVASGISLQLTPRYEAAATVRVASAPGGTDDYIYLLSLSRLSNTYIEIASSDSSLEQVAKMVGMQELPEVELETVPDTELIVITATNSDPVLACDIANTLANIMVEQSIQLYGGDTPTMREILEDQLQQAKIELDTAVIAYDSAIREYQPSPTLESGASTISDTYLETLSRLVGLRHQIYNELLVEYEEARINEQFHANAITIVEPAILPEEPSSPNLPLNAALGFTAGLVMGVILAFFLEGLDDSIRDIEDLQKLTTLPILCKVPVLKSKHATYRYLDLTRNDHPYPTSTFDQLYLDNRLFDTTRKFSAFAITSPEPGAGKSTFAVNCALAIANRGKTVTLIDLGFHRSPKHTFLGIPNVKGLSDFLHGDTPWEDLRQTTAHPNLWVITTGISPIILDELLTPEAIRVIFSKLRKQCAYVILDMPALQNNSKAGVIFAQAHTIVLVVARRKTPRYRLQNAIQQIDEYKSKVAGIAFNKATSTWT